jgi:hypothetical protein
VIVSVFARFARTPSKVIIVYIPSESRDSEAKDEPLKQQDTHPFPLGLFTLNFILYGIFGVIINLNNPLPIRQKISNEPPNHVGGSSYITNIPYKINVFN